MKEALADSFSNVSHSLATTSNIELYFSGSTCVSVLIVGNKVFCANVGDSRAVLAREIDEGVFGAFPLSRDHKPSDQDEMERITKFGGRIDSLRDPTGRPMGPMRVWHMK